MKYVVYESYTGLEVAVLFSKILDHKSQVPRLVKILGAGKCELEGHSGQIEINGRMLGDIEVCCYGESVTLNVKSRGAEDAEVIRKEIFRQI